MPCADLDLPNAERQKASLKEVTCKNYSQQFACQETNAQKIN